MAEAMSGQIIVVTAGTAVQGPTAVQGRKFLLSAPVGNTGEVYVGNDGAGDITNLNGFVVPEGSPVEISVVRTLGELFFDALNSGDVISWIRILD